MSTQEALRELGSLIRAPDEGDHFEFLNHLATIKVAGEGRSLSVVEFLGPKGFGPPEHRHDFEDELFVVLEGEMEFRTGGQRIEAVGGTCAYLVRGVPHTFLVRSDEARFLTVTTTATEPPRFDQLVSALGNPIAEPVMPQPGHIDPAEVARVGHDLGIEIVGPPPQ